MPALLVILLGTVLVNTFLLMHSNEDLGGDRHSGAIANAIRIGGASLLCVILSTSVAVLAGSIFFAPLGDSELLVQSICTAVVAIALHYFVGPTVPTLQRALATSPLLVVGNSLALSTLVLFDKTAHALQRVADAIFVGTGFGVLLVVFVALTARITEREVPIPFRLAPITLISAGMVALALMGFTGIFRT